MDTWIDPATGDYAGARISRLENAVYLRLMTPLGSWWADTSLGSRLHELAREKDVRALPCWPASTRNRPCKACWTTAGRGPWRSAPSSRMTGAACCM